MLDEEKKEYIEHEILDRLYCLEENDFDKNKVNDGYIKAVLNSCKEAKNLVEKQQKEIEELKNRNNKLMEELDLTTVYISGVYDGEKKVEDKIKAKIEECREILYGFEKELELKANKDKFIHKESMNCLLGQISILQSLLEKENSNGK